MICCWSVKGGVGTSVVAAAVAVMGAKGGDDVLLVDLAGDQAAILGVESNGPGLHEWLEAGEAVALDALRRLEIPVGPGLRLLAPGGESPDSSPAHHDRLSVALALTDRPGRRVVVDLGTIDPASSVSSVLAGAGRSVLVTRACYLALRRARPEPGGRGFDVVLVDEPGRALGRLDVARALGVGSVIRVPWEPSIARAVDAGTLTGRVPGPLKKLRALW